jgi:hypothetical protein
MLRRPAIAALTASLLLAACGGSAHSTSSSTSSSAGAGSSSATSTAVTTSTTTTAVTSSRPPEVPAGKAQSSSTSNPTAPDTDVRLPAAFAIEPGGNLTPPLVAAPKGVAIQLRLRNLDSRPHAFVLDTPTRYSFRVRARGRETTLITGLAKGTYRILVDGAARGRLVIGSTPGP